MTTFNHIAIPSVRQALVAGAPQTVTQYLVDAVEETYEAWQDDQHLEIDHASMSARENAIDALDDLSADTIQINSDASAETLALTWEAVRQYWTN